MIKKLLGYFVKDYNKIYINKLNPIIEQINQQEEKYQLLEESEFLKNTEKFKERVKNGESLDNLLVETFATIKNACRRLTEKKHTFKLWKNNTIWEMIPFDVQMVGGIILHRGNISEMKTGEGKTLVSVAPMYLNALTGKNCHIVTVNDYLAERDAHWMSQVYNYLWLSVGVIMHNQSPTEKKEQYACDITYGTNNEFGFDYLRDNMAVKSENQVMRDVYYAIVDEVDSILIDEARTPLIISAPNNESTDKYSHYSTLVKNLERDTHYLMDEKEKTVTLTEEGIEKMENLMWIENIYTEKWFEEVHHIEASLKAQAMFKRDTDYVVKDDEIIIVDEFTGRLMEWRRYSWGLHQAIEAKEWVKIKKESKTLASITFQNFFRLYDKLSGMTGTAVTESKEFAEIYGLDTFVIPTNQPIARIDRADAVFKNINGKYIALVRRVKEAVEQWQPVLIGTISIERSEVLSTLLAKAGIKHNVLNAKHHEKEADIIANAWQVGAITIATNMAGRGTDIKPSKEASENGGLLVIGTERHESRRIDNQLRWRSGRQWDNWESQFYVSMDDDLMRIFGSDRIKNMMNMMGLADDMPIENKMVSNAIESAQKKVENRNFEIRKHILQYDDVMNKHRESIYKKRSNVLNNKDIKSEIIEILKKYTSQIISIHTEWIKYVYWDYEELEKTLSQMWWNHFLSIEDLKEKSGNKPEILEEIIINAFLKNYKEKETSLPNPEILRYAEKWVYLQTIDRFWMDHIDAMSQLRETVSLQAYANKDPLNEYKREAFESFKSLNYDISTQTVRQLMLMEIQTEAMEIQRTAPSIENMSTNENEIENELNQSHILPWLPGNSNWVNVIKTASSGPQIVDKVWRNDPCPCGSGKKYKKCCG